MSVKPRPILMADDDHDDCELTSRALIKAKIHNPVKFVHDGEELLDYLHRRGKYSDPETSPRPIFILLDLNMPVLDGHAALREIKSDPDLRRIPVVVLTTSMAEEDVYSTYDTGVNSFVTKPVTFSGLVDAMETIGNYWLEIVEVVNK